MKFMPLQALGLLVFALLAPLSASAAGQQTTHEFTLDNGLKVIVREDHRAPLVVSQLWYKVGSSYETPGQTGLSHALEHMMFKGSAKLAPGEASRILRELGAEKTPLPATTTPPITRCWRATVWAWPSNWKPIAWPA